MISHYLSVAVGLRDRVVLELRISIRLVRNISAKKKCYLVPCRPLSCNTLYRNISTFYSLTFNKKCAYILGHRVKNSTRQKPKSVLVGLFRQPLNSSFHVFFFQPPSPRLPRYYGSRGTLLLLLFIVYASPTRILPQKTTLPCTIILQLDTGATTACCEIDARQPL